LSEAANAELTDAAIDARIFATSESLVPECCVTILANP
jgi:hypothetical protein